MARVVLFDLDGVLVDTYEVWFFLLNDVAHRLSAPPIGREIYRTSWGQGIEADVAKFYPGRSVDEIRRLYDEHFADHLERLRVMEGAVEFLRGIDLPKAVVTNSPVPVARRALEAARLDSFFETVVGSGDVARSKPAPDVVLEACRRLGTTPAEAVMVGDSDYDEQAARAAGTPFIRFESFADLKL